jgi:hypothetical protein
MRIGLLGPAQGNAELLREAAEFLLGDCGVDQAVYLGADDTAKGVVERWAAEVMGGEASEDAFLREAAKLAATGDPRQIDNLLRRDHEVQRLSSLRCLPPSPARAVEVYDDKVVLFVHDKGQLDEEDIANAFLVVYGRSKGSAFNRFGPRAFFTPGPLQAGGRVAVLEREDDGNLVIAMFDPQTGEPAGRETLVTKRTRLVVLS